MDEQGFGQSPSAPNFELRTPAAVLRARAAQQGSALAYTFLLDGETEEYHLSYADLDRRARMIGAALRPFRESGQRALLLYPPGLEYIAALFGKVFLRRGDRRSSVPAASQPALTQNPIDP